jgi:hypothetical protein
MTVETEKPHGAAPSSGSSAPSGDETNKFLFTVYEQCYMLLISQVETRVKTLPIFLTNAVLFYFLYSQKINPNMIRLVSIVGIVFALVLLFINYRLRYAVRRAQKRIDAIEKCLGLPVEMRTNPEHLKAWKLRACAFLKGSTDEYPIVSHATIFSLLGGFIFIFWLLFCCCPDLFLSIMR